MLSQAGFAQAPNGSFTSPTFSGTNSLYDLTGTISNLTVDLTASDGVAVPVIQDVSVAQSVTGVITASTTNTTVTVMAEDGTFTNAATYKMKGAVKSSDKGIIFSDVFTAKSGAFLGGDPTYTDVIFTESVTSLITIDPATGTITSDRSTGSATMRLGKKAKAGPLHNLTVQPANFTPVEWNLGLTLTSTVSKVTGTATVNLANDRSFPFNVKGTTKNGDSKLTLTGTGIGRGATLKVTMSGTNITAVTGSLLGQKVTLSE